MEDQPQLCQIPNQSVSEVISTYVYKVGLLGAQYSYTTAISLFNSVINIIVLIAPTESLLEIAAHARC